MKKEVLIGLFVLLITINYSFLDPLLINALEDYEIGVVSRVIYGDTVEINNESVRLLEINSPKRGEKRYEEAKQFLEEKILNENVEKRKPEILEQQKELGKIILKKQTKSSKKYSKETC